MNMMSSKLVKVYLPIAVIAGLLNYGLLLASGIIFNRAIVADNQSLRRQLAEFANESTSHGSLIQSIKQSAAVHSADLKLQQSDMQRLASALNQSVDSLKSDMLLKSRSDNNTFMLLQEKQRILSDQIVKVENRVAETAAQSAADRNALQYLHQTVSQQSAELEQLRSRMQLLVVALNRSLALMRNSQNLQSNFDDLIPLLPNESQRQNENWMGMTVDPASKSNLPQNQYEKAAVRGAKSSARSERLQARSVTSVVLLLVFSLSSAFS